MAVMSAPKSRLEHYQSGYPRVAAFLNLDPGFTMIRRFDELHLRILLEQQAEIGELENKLNQYDDNETTQLYLSSYRADKNQKRRDLIAELKIKLQEYDRSVQDYARMLQLAEASAQNQVNVKNWMEGTKPIVRSEAGWVSHLGADKFIALRPGDSSKAGLENILESTMRRWPRMFRSLAISSNKTNDPNIVLFRSSTLQWITRLTMSTFVPLWTIIPGILIFTTSEKASKVVMYSLFMISTSILVCFTTKTTNYSMVIAVISYAAVLATFLS